MAERDFDIFISGGGIAGLVAASAFGTAGFSVLLADPAPAPNVRDGSSADPRSTAFLLPSRNLLEEAGLWSGLVSHATCLNALRVVDTAGWPPEVIGSYRFLPKDLGETTFGWNISNRVVRDEAARRTGNLANVETVYGSGFRSILTRTDRAYVTLTKGRRLRARLVIAADGHGSPVREAVGISATTIRYGQKALTFEARHSTPHQNISTEIYSQGGAFTTVPLPDAAGQPASAIVWMDFGARAQDLAALDGAEFDKEMTVRSSGLFGPMQRRGPVRTWPVITRQAKRMFAERTALVAEAAHVLPPIGAQGLNTSLRDIAVLLDLARKDPGALGSPRQLIRYARARTARISLLVRTVDLVNRACMSSNPGVRSARRVGLAATHGIVPLRRAIMRAGMDGLRSA
ncbi:MAG: FAD-dependent monooxygenase [Rhodobacter sp.]|nr:FAD-dependent monooxygenase [Rhodobacter sp.]MCY4241445.1 FAD-dependent monooxygenase [Rhodobacter sp.]